MSSTLNPEWLNQVCVRLGRALGCEVSFQDRPDDGDHPAIPPSHILWQAPVSNGQHVTGRLLVHTPEQKSDGTSHQAVDAAALVAELLERVAVLESQLAGSDEELLLEYANRAGAPPETPVEMVQRLLRAAQRAGHCWATAFFLAEGTGSRLKLRATCGIEAAVIPQVMRAWQESPDGQAAVAGPVNLSAAATNDVPWLPEGVRSALVLPAKTDQGCLGTLWCFERRERDWLDSEVRRLKLVTAQLATGLERMVLLRDSDARRRLSHELTFASVRHSGHAMGQLTPESGLDVAIRTASSAELGGDLCEVWPLTSRQTLSAIGDATGHSVPAAMIMAVARGSLRTLLNAGTTELNSTERIAARLNQALYSVTQGEQFMTLVCGIIDRDRRTLTFTNAGHPAPWLIRSGHAMELTPHNMLLGVLPEATYEESVTRLEVGDWLVLFTDGISEATSADQQFFQSRGILNAFGSGHWSSAADAAEVVWQALQHHCGDLQATDDRTLLVMRVLG